MQRMTTACVVGADGAGSVVRRSLFPKQRMDVYVSIQQWFRAGDRNPFYSYGGAFRPHGCREAFERQKKKLQAYGFNFGEPVYTEACQVLRPHGPSSFCLGGDGAFLIGEAAGWISPSSLEGISSAILSATWLSQGMNCGMEQALPFYHRHSRELCRRLWVKCLKRWFMYTPWTRSFLMASGLSSIDLISPGNGSSI